MCSHMHIVLHFAQRFESQGRRRRSKRGEKQNKATRVSAVAVQCGDGDYD